MDVRRKASGLGLGRWFSGLPLVLSMLAVSVSGLVILSITQAEAAPSSPVIAPGSQHTCGVDVSGAAYCWGLNTSGQLGNGTLTNSLSPVEVVRSELPVGTTFDSIDPGSNFACAVSTVGGLSCWGNNGVGQVGDSTTLNRSTPVAVDVTSLPAGTAFTSVASGNLHACALSLAGSVYCWGFNASGQIGDGTTVNRSKPTLISGAGLPPGSTFTSVATGDQHSCAVSTAGAVYCWGSNGGGQIGDGTTSSRSTPVAVNVAGLPGGTSFTSAALGTLHSCAVATDGRAYCWGNNGIGQLGDASTVNRPTPVAVSAAGVPAGTTFTQVTAGTDHSCALASGGQVYCWGSNSSIHRQLGDGSTALFRSSPIAVNTAALPPGATFTSVSSSRYHTCATSTLGSAYCWGSNDFGRLGDGTTTLRSTPTLVLGFPPPDAPIYVLPADSGALSGVMAELAQEIPELEVLARNQGAGTFSRPGCSSATSPLPGSADDLIAAALGNSYLDTFGVPAGPLGSDCVPDVVTIYGP